MDVDEADEPARDCSTSPSPRAARRQLARLQDHACPNCRANAPLNHHWQRLRRILARRDVAGSQCGASAELLARGLVALLARLSAKHAQPHDAVMAALLREPERAYAPPPQDGGSAAAHGFAGDGVCADADLSPPLPPWLAAGARGPRRLQHSRYVPAACAAFPSRRAPAGAAHALPLQRTAPSYARWRRHADRCCGRAGLTCPFADCAVPCHTAAQLRRHMAADHLGRVLYHCPACPRAFHLFDLFHTHVHTAHPAAPPANARPEALLARLDAAGAFVRTDAAAAAEKPPAPDPLLETPRRPPAADAMVH